MQPLGKYLVLLWTLVVVPALCPAGLLVHACPEDSSTSCTHEDDCAADPCLLSQATTPPALVKTLLPAAVAPLAHVSSGTMESDPEHGIRIPRASEGAHTIPSNRSTGSHPLLI
jgi:hypothetical protein